MWSALWQAFVAVPSIDRFCYGSGVSVLVMFQYVPGERNKYKPETLFGNYFKTFYKFIDIVCIILDEQQLVGKVLSSCSSIEKGNKSQKH